MKSKLENLIGQMIIAGFRGDTVNEHSAIVEYIKNYNLAGVILYDEDLEIGGTGSRNISSPSQVKQLLKDLKHFSNKNDLLISIDQEGGEVCRLKSIYGFNETPSWKKVGLFNNELITQQFSDRLAKELSDLGINLNFAPVLDLYYGEKTVIGNSQRAFCSDPKLLTKHAEIFINAHKKRNIISCGKHFPGQGSAHGDTHEGLTDITKTWSVKDMLPFDKIIQKELLDIIMVSHTIDKKIDPNNPASLSKTIITEMLRNDLGFEGIVICDDPSMRAISDNYSLFETFKLMLDAGVDLFCLGNNLIYDPDYIPKAIKAISKIVDHDKSYEKKVMMSIERIEHVKSLYNINVR